mmetsp:Transcript_49342/g.56919  ORF Transcript_49342/g.56919 Transcript_49342/m.56919 type:complete len:694 (+) Transcript_49342:93-2174(+)
MSVARFTNVHISFRIFVTVIFIATITTRSSGNSNSNSNSDSNKHNSFFVNANNHVVIAPRHCHGSVRHLHLAVGKEPSRSMTVSFASTWAFPDRIAPIAGVLVGTSPPSTKKGGDNKNSYEYTKFLNSSRFVPEMEDPITYTIYMDNHKGNESALYYAPYQHHITIGGLEPDTKYYYLPVLGNRESGIQILEKRARLSSIQTKLLTQRSSDEGEKQQLHHSHVENIKTEEKLTNEQQQLINKEVANNIANNVNNGSENGDMRQLQNLYHSHYNETYLERDYDDNTEIFEISPETSMWDINGRRLSPPPYDPTGLACIDAERIRNFRTAPEEEEKENKIGSDNDNDNDNKKKNAMYPMVFGIIGDVGQFEHSQQILNHMRDHPKGMRAVILAGDVSYPEFDGRKWDTFFDFLDDQSNFDEIPLMIAAGNHDIDKQFSRKEIFLGYEHRFRMPRVHPPELGLYEGEDEKLNMDTPPYPLPYEWGNSYYAFTYGPTRHVVVNAYSDLSPGSTQYEWIKEELASIDRKRTPWILLTLHPPIYNTFSLHHKDPQIFAARDHIEPLMVEHHVNIVLTGHIHAYQRTDYVAFNATTPTGPMHITVGAGGRKCDAPFTSKEPEKWLMKRDASMYGYGRLVIENITHAEWRWIPIAPSELHDYNQVKGEEAHLPSLDHDKVSIENQYHIHLRQLNEGGKVER